LQADCAGDQRLCHADRIVDELAWQLRETSPEDVECRIRLGRVICFYPIHT
jgi:hypothetical protein